MKECLKPHALLHSVTGVGVGLLVASYVSANATMLGVVLVVAGLAGEFLISKK